MSMLTPVMYIPLLASASDPIVSTREAITPPCSPCTSGAESQHGLLRNPSRQALPESDACRMPTCSRLTDGRRLG